MLSVGNLISTTSYSWAVSYGRTWVGVVRWLEPYRIKVCHATCRFLLCYPGRCWNLENYMRLIVGDYLFLLFYYNDMNNKSNQSSCQLALVAAFTDVAPLFVGKAKICQPCTYFVSHDTEQRLWYLGDFEFIVTESMLRHFSWNQHVKMAQIQYHAQGWCIPFIVAMNAILVCYHPSVHKGQSLCWTHQMWGNRNPACWIEFPF